MMVSTGIRPEQVYTNGIVNNTLTFLVALACLSEDQPVLSLKVLALQVN